MEFGHLEGVPQPQFLGTYYITMVANCLQVMGWPSKYMGVKENAFIMAGQPTPPPPEIRV